MGTPASSTTKTGRHDIAEILLKVVLNTINHYINQSTILSLLVLLSFMLELCKKEYYFLQVHAKKRQ